MSACAYCLKARGTTTDHFIKKNQVARNPRLKGERENPRYKVRACSDCNLLIYTRLRVPESHAHLIAELEALTSGKYATFSGDPSDLREVVK